MVYIRAHQFRHISAYVALVMGAVAALVLPIFLPDESFALAAFAVVDVTVAIFAFGPSAFTGRFLSDRMDIFVDDGSICGPVKKGYFALARPEAVPLSAVDQSRSRYRFLFGSYLALADGRKLIVSTMAHPTRNVRRVFEAVEARTREP